MGLSRGCSGPSLRGEGGVRVVGGGGRHGWELLGRIVHVKVEELR